MKFKLNPKYTQIAVYAIIVIVLSGFLLLSMNSFPNLSEMADKLFAALAPIIWGCVIAYLLNPGVDFFRFKVFKKQSKTAITARSQAIIRNISVTIVVILAIGVITGLIFLIVPQLATSLKGLVDKFDEYIDNFILWFNNIFGEQAELTSAAEARLLGQHFPYATYEITLDELTGHLRLKDVLDLKSVQFAILATNGDLSVFPYPSERPAPAKEAGIETQRQALPVTVIEDGYFSAENLALTGKDEHWLENILEQMRAAGEDAVKLSQLDFDFHSALVRITHNELLLIAFNLFCNGIVSYVLCLKAIVGTVRGGV